MTFNAGDLEEALENLNMDEDGEAISDDKPYWGQTGFDILPECNLGETVTAELEVRDGVKVPVEVKVVDISTGTYDGDTYIILEAGGRNFRKNGWSASHYGTEWEGSFEEVESYTKTETYWRKKK